MVRFVPYAHMVLKLTQKAGILIKEREKTFSIILIKTIKTYKKYYFKQTMEIGNCGFVSKQFFLLMMK